MIHERFGFGKLKDVTGGVGMLAAIASTDAFVEVVRADIGGVRDYSVLINNQNVAAKTIAYEIDTTLDNPDNVASPLWMPVATGTVAADTTTQIDKKAVGVAIRVLVKSNAAGNPANFLVFLRLNP